MFISDRNLNVCKGLALLRSVAERKTREGYNLWIDDNLQPGRMKNAADKVVKFVKPVYNPFAFDIP